MGRTTERTEGRTMLVETLADLVLASRGTLDERTRDRLDTSPGLRDLRERLAAAGDGAHPVEPSDFVARHLRSLLSVPVVAHVLVEVWNDAGAFPGFQGPDPAEGEVIDLPLDDHPLHVEYTPALEVRLGEDVMGTIPFRISARFDVTGAVVLVRDGAIVDVREGRLRGEAEIRCGDVLLLRETIAEQAIPGTVPRPTRAAAA